MSTDKKRSSSGSKSKKFGKAVSFNIGNKGNSPEASSRGFSFQEYFHDFKLELYTLSTIDNLFLILMYVLLLCASFSMGLQYAMKPTITEDVQCHIKELDTVKWSFDQKKNVTSPPSSHGCSYYDINYSVLKNLSYEDAVEESKGMIANNPQPRKCTKYLYKTYMSTKSSIVREFNLICDQRSFYSFNFFTQVGGAVGAFPFGIASDIHGRQPAFIFAGLITVIGGCIIPLAPNLPFFITGNVLVGAGSITIFLSALVLFTEFCRNKYRSSLTMMSFIAWHLGSVVNDAILFNYIKSWRLLQLANECPFLIVVQSVAFVPESPRWLMNQKQVGKAWEVLQIMGSTEIPTLLPHYPFALSNCLKQSRIFIKSYFQYRTYITVILSGIGSLTYYAVLAIARNTTPSQIQNILTKTSMKIIFLLLIARAAYSCNKRSICCNIFLLLGTCFIASVVTDSPIVSDVTMLLAEIMSVTVCMVVYVYVLEIFPTSHRATALGLNFSLTQSVKLLYLYYQYEMSYKINVQVLKGFFCSFCIISALLTMLAPITYQDIPDTREDLIKDLTIAEKIAFSY